MSKKPLLPLPESVKIGGKTITIQWMTGQWAGANRRFGEFSAPELTIRVDETTPRHNRVTTLVHEILHACYFVWNIYGDDDEERTVASMSNALCSIWRDNPDLFSWIQQELSSEL